MRLALHSRGYSVPDAFRIEDLTQPVMPEGWDEQVEAVRPMADALELEPDAVIAQATNETGLDDFGPDGWQTGLGVALDAFGKDYPLSPMGKLSSYGACVDFLKNRLKLEDLIKRHPDILDVELQPPIVIAGLPRSGTTHLHNLLGAAPGLRELRWWEALEPVLAPDEAPGATPQTDPRWARAQAGIDARNSILPHFDAMHEMTVDHVHEEIHLFGLDFGTMFFENMGAGRLPSWRDYYLGTDQTPHYRYLERVQKALSWLRGGDRWVMKSPQHLEQFAVLRSVFPEATIAVTHRDPVSTVASFATMVTYSSRTSAAQVDAVEMGRYWTDRVEQMLRACTEDRALLDDAHTLDVLFHEYMGDEVATVGSIYEKAGLDFGKEARDAIDAYQRAHPRGRFGRVLYDLADFGLDAGTLRERFRFYTDRFPVRLEQ
jgi:hypothetical protein